MSCCCAWSCVLDDDMSCPPLLSGGLGVDCTCCTWLCSCCSSAYCCSCCCCCWGCCAEASRCCSLCCPCSRLLSAMAAAAVPGRTALGAPMWAGSPAAFQALASCPAPSPSTPGAASVAQMPGSAAHKALIPSKIRSGAPIPAHRDPDPDGPSCAPGCACTCTFLCRSAGLLLAPDASA